MLPAWFTILISVLYLGILFGIAYYAHRRADQGQSLLSNPLIYALSLTVYCTSWTFYGSVGRAVNSGVQFLAIYLGPTLAALLWWLVLRKIIRISKINRITSIADFIASRYGKSTLLGGLVTLIAVIGIVPYIALQLKAVSISFDILLRYPQVDALGAASTSLFWNDTALVVALVLAAFTIVFGTRHLDATERHEGMVAAIAFDSVVKLVAFLAVGLFVTYHMYDGAADLFRRAVADPALQPLLTLDSSSYGTWAALTLLSMSAVMFLPRQFQVAVVENVDEQHLNTAIWMFPLYLFIINIFVLPIAIGGLLRFPGGADADMFVLTLPMAEGRADLTLFAFLGGVAAATGMVIVETIALSTMVCNDLVMPILLRWRRLRLAARSDVSWLLLLIRRAAIVVVLLLGYAYFRLAGGQRALVEIGLVSFAAVAQFAPALLGGIFWTTGNRLGALVGLTSGFLVWAYTLLTPTLVQADWLPLSLVDSGPFGILWLRPGALFGLDGMDQIAHALFWSMLVNIGGYVAVSLMTEQHTLERQQAAHFVNVFRHSEPRHTWRGRATVQELRTLLGRFLGPAYATALFTAYAWQHDIRWEPDAAADADLVHFAETQLAGTIGAASARVMIASVVKDEVLDIHEMREMLDEASQVIAYSHQLQQKSRELEAATAELRAANARLQELDKLKDEFIATVTHELRTPLTSIRAFSEILLDNPQLDLEQRDRSLSIIIKESERLTRLINQVLDLAKIESGNAEWHITEVDLREVVEESLLAISQIFSEQNICLDINLPDTMSVVFADQDRLIQVMLNLLSNAAKFCDPLHGYVAVRLHQSPQGFQVDVCDNGPGVLPEHREVIFDKFRQVGDTLTNKPHGTGLGLPICRQIIAHFNGKLWVESTPGHGATFSFVLPCSPTHAQLATNGAGRTAEEARGSVVGSVR